MRSRAARDLSDGGFRGSAPFFFLVPFFFFLRVAFGAGLSPRGGGPAGTHPPPFFYFFSFEWKCETKTKRGKEKGTRALVGSQCFYFYFRFYFEQKKSCAVTLRGRDRVWLPLRFFIFISFSMLFRTEKETRRHAPPFLFYFRMGM